MSDRPSAREVIEAAFAGLYPGHDWPDNLGAHVEEALTKAEYAIVDVSSQLVHRGHSQPPPQTLDIPQ